MMKNKRRGVTRKLKSSPEEMKEQEEGEEPSEEPSDHLLNHTAFTAKQLTGHPLLHCITSKIAPS